MRRVVIETPFRPKADPGTPEFEAETARNAAYLNEALLDSIRRGEAPFASHAIYTRVLDESDPNRALGLAMGEAWRQMADATVFYTDLGFSPGMDRAVEKAKALGQTINVRRIRK